MITKTAIYRPKNGQDTVFQKKTRDNMVYNNFNN